MNREVPHRFTVLTLFPEMILGGLCHSVLKRAMDSGLIEIGALNIRDFADNKHKQADDYPYGGGCGMVMTPGPVYGACRHAIDTALAAGAAPRIIYMTPTGTPFTQAKARELAAEPWLIFLCGHYEGIDQRAIDLIAPEEISLGDFVLTGGELPAMAVIDAVARLVPGVLNNDGSALDESFSEGLLEYPQYTRPAAFMGRDVPEILLSGDHGQIAAWRKEKSREITAAKRPDLIRKQGDA